MAMALRFGFAEHSEFALRGCFSLLSSDRTVEARPRVRLKSRLVPGEAITSP